MLIACLYSCREHATLICSLFFSFSFSIHFIIPFGKFGPPYLGKTTEAATQSCKYMLDLLGVSVIHRTLTWTTWSLTRVSDHSYAGVYTRGLGTPTTQHFWPGKLTQCYLVLLTGSGFEPLVFGSRAQRSTHWASPSPHCDLCQPIVILHQGQGHRNEHEHNYTLWHP